MSFAENLEIGRIGEGEVSRWLQARGYSVLPAYEIEQAHFKGPRLFRATGDLIAPDMLVFNSRRVFWAEAKTKNAFTWHRISQSWQTGIDRRHWRDYVEVSRVTPWPVWLLFLHKAGTAKDTPAGLVSPSGLFGNLVKVLLQTVDHESDRHGPSGMVYWKLEDLRCLG